MPRNAIDSSIKCHLELLVVTNEVQSDVGWVIHSDAFADESPAHLDRGGGSGQLEIVDVNNKEEVKSFVVVTTSPVWDAQSQPTRGVPRKAVPSTPRTSGDHTMHKVRVLAFPGVLGN